jgi:hypothetical protein
MLAFLILGEDVLGDYPRSMVLGEGRLERFRAAARSKLWEALREPG